ncbi:hypothetical protein SCUCBS95973_007143 [Sporothrix curviconia]|uniref:Uncharacterized protein n=1 Tax=Sporothrix curviconia TaxID=1260050 RepID=A0ABP0CAV7_9PEZI
MASGSGLILSGLDAENLQNEGLAGPGAQPGFLRVHKRRLYRSSEEENQDMPLVSVHDASMQHAFATIPEYLISRQALTHAGLADDCANDIWSSWLNRPAAGQDDNDSTPPTVFFDFILQQIRSHDAPVADVRHDDDVWRRSLEALGASPDLVSAIMDPHFACIRDTESSVFWLEDTVSMRLAGLQAIQDASHERGIHPINTSGTLSSRAGRDHPPQRPPAVGRTPGARD